MLVSECFGLDAVELVEYFLEGIPEKVELPWRLGLASMEAVDLGNDVTSTLLNLTGWLLDDHAVDLGNNVTSTLVNLTDWLLDDHIGGLLAALGT